jgi:hypothetical protein
MIITTTRHVGVHASWTGYACANALDSDFSLFGRRAVSPVYAPSTGGVRPQAGTNGLMATRLVDEKKDRVRLRCLGPPI